MGAILPLLSIVIQELPGAITTVEQLYSLGTKFAASVKGSAPTDQELADLKAAIDSDLADALTPLPAAQPGDPDYQPPGA